MLVSFRKFSISGVASLLLVANAGCGLHTPDIAEFWGAGTTDAQRRVIAIVSQIRCEIREGINELIRDDYLYEMRNPGRKRRLQWIENWGAQVLLTLTIDESTTVNAGAGLLYPRSDGVTLLPRKEPIISPRFFNLGFGVDSSATATRTNKLNMVYSFKEFLKEGAKNVPCEPARVENSVLLVQSDLKLKDWLYTVASMSWLDLARFPKSANDGPLGEDVITHQVKFEIVTSGSITPVWRLVQASVNDGNTFFNSRRSRSQEIQITMGPIESTPTGGIQLASNAANINQAAVIGSAVANAIRN